jgi:hypothetical protein
VDQVVEALARLVKMLGQEELGQTKTQEVSVV